MVLAGLLAGGLVAGTILNPDFWSSPDQRGDRLMAKKRYGEAAKSYADPLRIGIAQYRDSQFEAAAKTFAKVPGATGSYNAGNAWLMHGQYAQAIVQYDKALGFKPGWKEASDNKRLAIARKALMEKSNENAAEEATDAYKPDEIVFDLKGKGSPEEPKQMIEAPMDDAALQATWLRRVKTKPADFLRAKFAWQASERETGGKE
jgi:Ca-activated chloride channel family protein